jgi:hypothetical protein
LQVEQQRQGDQKGKPGRVEIELTTRGAGGKPDGDRYQNERWHVEQKSDDLLGRRPLAEQRGHGQRTGAGVGRDRKQHELPVHRG